MTSRNTYNEEEIIEQLHDPKRCQAAFGKVIEQYSQGLYWQIRRMVFNHDDANDILQNTFLKAWSNIDNFRGNAKLSTWLYKIAINESIIKCLWIRNSNTRQLAAHCFQTYIHR